MGGSYKQCGACGKRALSIATRCPGCGRELGPAQAPEPRASVELGRYVSPGLAGVVAIAAVLLAVELGGTDQTSGRSDSTGAVESARADSIAASSEVAYAMGATARLDTASVEATTEAEPGRYLVARTWTNVRKSRSTRADLEAVLTPGDTVFADSLQRDWYRVTFEGEPMGYAHRTTLTTP